jgi:hypothetical protein
VLSDGHVHERRVIARTGAALSIPSALDARACDASHVRGASAACTCISLSRLLVTSTSGMASASVAFFGDIIDQRSINFSAIRLVFDVSPSALGLGSAALKIDWMWQRRCDSDAATSPMGVARIIESHASNCVLRTWHHGAAPALSVSLSITLRRWHATREGLRRTRTGSCTSRRRR